MQCLAMKLKYHVLTSSFFHLMLWVNIVRRCVDDTWSEIRPPIFYIYIYFQLTAALATLDISQSYH